MRWFLLGGWLVQASVGVTLLARGRLGRTVVTHVALIVLALALWIAFLAAGERAYAWLAFGVLSVALAYGDVMLVGRWRRLHSTRSHWLRDYVSAIRGAMHGDYPPRVMVHTWFSPVVWFGALAACLIA